MCIIHGEDKRHVIRRFDFQLHTLRHRELKLDGAKGDFADPL